MSPEATHFTNPLTEQRQLMDGRAYIAWQEKAVISVSGANARDWLHSLLSQNIANLKPGESTEALLLDPQGRVEQIIQLVVEDESRLLLIVPQSHASALLDWLRKMIFRSGVRVEDVSDRYQLIGCFQPIAELAEFPAYRDTWPEPRPGGVRYSDWKQPFGYREYLLPRDTQLPGALQPAGQLAFDGLRIWAGRPQIVDMDERSLPHEFDLLTTAVHMSKGCYRGQETVAKVHNLGHPPRRIVLLEFDASESLPAKGDLVFDQASGREVGKVLVVGQHYEAGPIALALVSRVTIPTATLSVTTSAGNLQATQQLLVPPTAGATVERPKLPKLQLGSKR